MTTGTVDKVLGPEEPRPSLEPAADLLPQSDKSFWRDRPTLVTGATGFLGGWIVRKLLERQAQVVCVVRDWVPQCELVRSKLIEKVHVIRGDVRDQTLLERALGESEIRTVLHLAAQTTVGISNRNPISTLDTNVRGTWSLLEACRRSPLVGQIVVASSDKAYGDRGGESYDEGDPLLAKHPYDMSKACADMIAQSYNTTYGLPVSITRCGNFYGGGDLNWNRLVPGTIRSVIRGQRPAIRSDGHCVRDYFYIEDAAHAYLLLAESMAARQELHGQAFNFSCEHPLTVIELATKVIQLMNSDLELDIENTAQHEIGRQCLSARKARAVLQWKPQFTLEEGLQRTIGWYKDFFRA